MAMFVAEIWRYPVKSMGGEPLEGCELTLDGIPGDRVVHVEDDRGKVVTSRSRPGLLLHQARLGDDGEPRVDGRPWRDPSVLADVERAVGGTARLIHFTGPERFDMEPVLLATDGAIAWLGYDRRRFRPNLLLGGVEGLAERTWEGRRLAIGDAVLFAVALRQRCIMTTFDPDSAEQDVEVLKRIHRELDGRLALDCRVERPGRVRVNDEARLV
jgi:uncharacterized protein YcbX